jgi:hypothetical protein
MACSLRIGRFYEKNMIRERVLSVGYQTQGSMNFCARSKLLRTETSVLVIANVRMCLSQVRPTRKNGHR